MLARYVGELLLAVYIFPKVFWLLQTNPQRIVSQLNLVSIIFYLEKFTEVNLLPQRKTLLWPSNWPMPLWVTLD